MCGTGGVTGDAETNVGGADSNPTSSTNTEELKDEVGEQIEDVKEEVTDVAEVYTDIPKDMENTLTDISGEAVGALNNAVAVGTSLSKQINTALKRQGMMGGMSGYDETLEDPTLAGRRRRGRRRGNEKDVRSGALKIPSSSVGVQIPA